MPSSATITTFYSFTANTRARSSQVNTNFSLFRGHLMPIDPNTSTAINNTYDLGSGEYYWRKAYAGTLNIRGATSTSTPELTCNTNTVTGNFVFNIGGGEEFRIIPGGPATATVGRYAMKSRSSTSAGSDPGRGNYAIGSGVASTYTFSGATTMVDVAGSTLTLSCVGGLIQYGFYYNGSNPTYVFVANTSGGFVPMLLNIYDGTTTSLVGQIRVGSEGSSIDQYFGSYSIVFPVASGSHTFFMRAGPNTGGGGSKLGITGIPYVVEL